jgi:LCP family protein required for cell wall assembly
MRDQRRAAGKTLVAALSALVLLVTGYGWRAYHSLSSGLTKSDALAGLVGSGASSNGPTNILIMGLDSRLDQNGNPLPKAVLDQLHAGDSSDGGYNTNVLMLLHVPGDGGKATAISIPRDDYVSLPGDPDGVSKQKIKQGYGLAKDAKERQLRAQGMTDPATLEQQGREAGRREAIETVQQFLGGVPIDHFVEVTLVGFYDLAKALGTVTVCLKGPTQDSYSGAKFVKGYQQVDAAQALAFVRQRRDYVHPELNFTDLDRERRQQAFLASAAYQLRSLGSFADPARLQGLIDVAKKDVVIDNEFDLLSFLQQSQGLLSGNITFTTLPVKKFGKVDGQDVNIVDVSQIQAMVRNLLNPDDASAAPAAPPAATPAALPSATLDVVNASGQDGMASSLEKALSARGLTQGTASTGDRIEDRSVLEYAPDAQDTADALAGVLDGMSVQRDSALRSGHVRLVIGSDFTMPPGLTDDSSSADSSAGSTAAAGSSAAPAAPATSISGGGIPCVK